MIISALSFLIFAPLYFIHYSSPATGHPSESVARMIIFFFRFSGSHVLYPTENWTIIAGVITLIIFRATLPIDKKLHIEKSALPIVCISGFVISTMAVGSIFRCDLGEIASRYLIYPHLLAAISFIFLLNRFNTRKFIKPLSFALALLFLFAYNQNFWDGRSNIIRINHELKTARYYYPNEEGVKPTVEEACRLNIYCIENHRSK